MNSSSHNSHIKAIELQERLQNAEPLNLLDVREQIEYYTRNIGGLNIPLAELTKNLAKLTWQHADEIIIVCSAGLRSKTAQSILKENGYVNVRNLTGGLLAIEKLKTI